MLRGRDVEWSRATAFPKSESPVTIEGFFRAIAALVHAMSVPLSSSADRDPLSADFGKVDIKTVRLVGTWENPHRPWWIY